MNYSLSSLRDTSRYRPKSKRLGRGAGSGLGKTCGRGQKGMGARSGYGKRLGYEGGQFRTFMKQPIRGFSNAPFRETYQVVNFDQIERHFEEGELVDAFSLFCCGLIGNMRDKVKILGKGELTKRVEFDVDAFSSKAREVLISKGWLERETDK